MEINSSEIKRYKQIAAVIGAILIMLFTLATNYALPIFTVIIIFAAAFIVAQINIAPLFMFMVLVIPMSINQRLFDSEVTLLMPSEPIEAILTLAFGIKLLFGYKVSPQLLQHPIFLTLIFVLLAQYFSIITSGIPMVSIKTIFLKSCYFIVFFMVSADLYLKKACDHISVLKTYSFSLLIIGIVIFFKHLDFGLSKDISGSVTEPFYADHTIYSACLAFILPLPLLTFFNSKKLNINFYQFFWIGLLAAVLLIFLFFTFCRAAWVSFVIASIIVLMVYQGLKFKGLLFLIVSAFSLFVIFQTEIFDSIKQNKADSNAKNASVEQQTKSVTNITSDQSNAERLNRWSCAYRMFLDQPFLGYGPGTYQFEYLSYQKKSEMTRISVTSPYNIKKGKGGTAHSEYLLLLAESGIFSLILYLASILLTIYYAIKVYVKATDSKTKVRILIFFFGFCTYILHAFFNNFLDTDKAALLYYTSIAAIMVEAIILEQTLKQKTI